MVEVPGYVRSFASAEFETVDWGHITEGDWYVLVTKKLQHANIHSTAEINNQ